MTRPRDQLEPGCTDDQAGRIRSTAISLKRIADGQVAQTASLEILARWAEANWKLK